MRLLLTADPMLPVPPKNYGGIERIIDALAGEFRARGHVVGLLAKAGSTCDADAHFSWPISDGQGVSATLRQAAALFRATRVFAPDLVHSFSRLAFLLPSLALRRTPAVMSYQRHTGARQIRWARRIAGPQLRFTGCSDFICNQGRQGGGSWTAIPNFVDTRRYDFVPAVPADAPLVFLSRIEAIKGTDLAIAIARQAGRRLLIAGNRVTSGEGARYFDEKIAPHLGRDGIEWIGEVDDAAKNRLLGSAAALVVPVQWDEPFGIVFAEALATGTPVITCARGALPEIVEEGHTGYFVTTQNEGATAVQKLSLLDRAACRHAAETKFSLSVCADRYLALYREMLA